jgi:hypothetical protein
MILYSCPRFRDGERVAKIFRISLAIVLIGISRANARKCFERTAPNVRRLADHARQKRPP